MNAVARLELVWPNKERFLLAPKDEAGKPVWVERDHPAAAEVRISDFTGECGIVNRNNPYADNLLFTGDSLDVMRILNEVPEFRREYRGKIKLAYWDPPFNTEQTFTHYDDWMDHSTWLSFMRERLLLVKDLVAPDGSIWMHLDDKEVHRMRCLMDEVFGAQNSLGTFTWEKLYARKSNTRFSSNTDFILCYAKDARKVVTHLLPASEEQLARYINRDDDPRGLWQSVSFHVRTDNAEKRQPYRYGIELPSGRVAYPPAGRHWNGKQPRYEALKESGSLWFGVKGDSLPRLKMFLNPDEIGLVPATLLPRQEVGDNDEAKSHLISMFKESPDVFQTPKPERLLQRILQVATQSGDVVLDCFAGSGTTAAVAHKMGRRWITSEILTSNVYDFTEPRLRKVVAGADMGGISTRTVITPTSEDLPDGSKASDFTAAVRALKLAVETGLIEQGPELKAAMSTLRALGKVSKTTEVLWTGGGGFRTVEVGPSMYEVTEFGVLLADWATNGRFARAVAGQLGFEWQSKKYAPFCGVRGRMRLAVLDGALGEEEVRQIVSALEEKERVTIVAKAVLPGAEELLSKLSRGSKIRKAPRDVLAPARSRRQRKDTVK